MNLFMPGNIIFLFDKKRRSKIKIFIRTSFTDFNPPPLEGLGEA